MARTGLSRSRLVASGRLGWPLAIVASALLLASAAAGCGGSSSKSSQTATGAAAQKKVFGFSMPFLTNEFFIALNDITVKKLKADGWKILPTTNANQQPDKQITDVQNLIASGATALAVDPFDSSGIVPALNAAEKKDVPVVLVDVGADGGEAYMSVRADNKKAGATVCDQMGKELAKANGGTAQGTVLELQGELSSVAGLDRTNGFEDCMKKKYAGVKIVGKPTHWQGPAAADATQTVVGTEKIDGIYMQSDCGMLAPVLSVLKQAGKRAKVGEAGHIILGAIDGCPPSLDHIRNGDLDFTVDQPLVQYGQRVSYFLDSALKGKRFKTGPDGFGGHIVTAPTGLEDLIPASLVTKENVDSPKLWGNQAKG